MRYNKSDGVLQETKPSPFQPVVMIWLRPLKKIFPFITVLLLCVAADAGAHCIAIVQSARIGPYNDAITEFERALAGFVHYEGPKRIHPVIFPRYVLSAETPGGVLDKIAADNPTIILAVGSNALSLAKETSGIPIVYCMVPDPRSIIGKRSDATGVRMGIAPGRQLAALTGAIPGIRRIGLVYDPGESGGLVRRAEAFARKQGLTLVAVEADSAKDVPALVSAMEGDIDAFWMLPDKTVLTPQTAEYILLFSLETGTLVFTFSEKYLDAGAAICACFDAAAVGRQAAVMARRILAGAAVRDVPPEDLAGFGVKLNDKVLRRLGIAANPGTETAVEPVR
jgi:putative ABC transport system substrate-binding protein